MCGARIVEWIALSEALKRVKDRLPPEKLRLSETILKSAIRFPDIHVRGKLGTKARQLVPDSDRGRIDLFWNRISPMPTRHVATTTDEYWGVECAWEQIEAYLRIMHYVAPSREPAAAVTAASAASVAEAEP
jgi:hypothetical protein